MNFQFYTTEGNLPCEVVIDDEEHRYWIRNADTTGEFFASRAELIQWVKQNWNREQFTSPQDYDQLLSLLR